MKLDPRGNLLLPEGRITWVANIAVSSLFIMSASSMACLSRPTPQSRADTLVQQLRDLPTPLPLEPSNGSILLSEQRRRELYEQLRQFGNEGVEALSRGLRDKDVQLRKNVALAFGLLAGGWFDVSWPKLDIRSALPALIAALQDSDGNVKGWSAQAIGEIGSDAVQAVPALVTLLASADEGSRNSACIGLRGIGPPAKEALPALRKSLTDPSADVRRFAELAINSIQQ
jgi:HEAT repeat protein